MKDSSKGFYLETWLVIHSQSYSVLFHISWLSYKLERLVGYVLVNQPILEV